MKKIKILLITSMPWREDNNIGNSYSNIFGGMDNLEFAHIYCRSGLPQNTFVKKYFQITEQALVKNLLKPSTKTGKAFYIDSPAKESKDENSALYDKMRILRWQSFFLARDLIWTLGRWKTKELDQFVEEFNPDLIFGTLTYMPNINKLMVYLKKKLDKPMITYSWDDVYSLKQFSLSPIFWLRKTYQRAAIRKCVRQCEFMYTITENMQKEYSKYFNIECKMLYKGYDFNGKADICETVNSPIKLVFMGNIGAGRWKTLVSLAKAIENINSRKSGLAELYIYTLSPKSQKMTELLSRGGSSYFMEAVPSEEVMAVQKSADILVHVEPTKLNERLFYRLSFSTKIVDYFFNARCILGIGGKTATLDYLKDHDAGIVIYNLEKLEETLLDLFENSYKITELATKAWDCGVKNHQRDRLKNLLSNDFRNLILNQSTLN